MIIEELKAVKQIYIRNRFYLLFLLSNLLSATPIIAAEQPMYQITKVKAWDTLNMRAEAGVKSKIIAHIPANGTSISLAGAEVTIGKTHWVKVNWQGKQGWVSQYFLKPMQTQSAPVLNKETKAVTKKITATQQSQSVKKTIDMGVGRNQWILRCSNKQPFWRVDVYPKALKLFTGKASSLLPITYMKQDKNKWNTAKRTHLKGATAKDKIDLDIRYSYQKCEDALSQQKVPYKVTVDHNGNIMTGCCRALKIN